MKVGDKVKKRLIKKIIKQMTDSELFECVAYESNKRWLYIAEIEFEKRLKRNSIAWKETPKGYKTIQFEVN